MTQDTEIKIKRFFLPGVILEENCPECGKLVVKDLNNEYLSFPHHGTTSVPFHCFTEGKDDKPDVEHEFEVDYDLEVTLTRTEPKPKLESPTNYRSCPTHCCQIHGCKYGYKSCPVATKEIKGMTGCCEDCGLTLEGYFGEDKKRRLEAQLLFQDELDAYLPGVQIRLKGNPLDSQTGQSLDPEIWYEIEEAAIDFFGPLQATQLDKPNARLSPSNFCVKIKGHWIDSAWIDDRYGPIGQDPQRGSVT